MCQVHSTDEVGTYLCPFYEETGSEKLSIFPEFMQLVKGRAMIHIWNCLEMELFTVHDALHCLKVPKHDSIFFLRFSHSIKVANQDKRSALSDVWFSSYKHGVVKLTSVKRHPALFSQHLCPRAGSSVQIQYYIHQIVKSDFIRGWRKGVGNKRLSTLWWTRIILKSGGNIFSIKKIPVTSLSKKITVLYFS